MKKITLFLAALLLMGSCSSYQFGGVVTGSSLGGLFGSAIGGILGGPRGHDAGAAIGMLAGAAVGAAATAPKTDSYQEEVYYESRRPSSHYYPQPSQPYYNYNVEVTNVCFQGEDNNRRLDANEKAYLTMDFYNRDSQAYYDLSPRIVCSNSKVRISPATIIGQIAPGQGVRYRVALVGGRRMRANEVLTFSVYLGDQLVKTIHLNR